MSSEDISGEDAMRWVLCIALAGRDAIRTILFFYEYLYNYATILYVV